MVSIINPPKDTLKLLAENIEKFKMIRDSWISSGNLLYADYSNKTYEAAALFSGKVVMCQFHNEENKESVEVSQKSDSSEEPDSTK